MSELPSSSSERVTLATHHVTRAIHAGDTITVAWSETGETRIRVRRRPWFVRLFDRRRR